MPPRGRQRFFCSATCRKRHHDREQDLCASTNRPARDKADEVLHAVFELGKQPMSAAVYTGVDFARVKRILIAHGYMDPVLFVLFPGSRAMWRTKQKKKESKSGKTIEA